MAPLDFKYTEYKERAFRTHAIQVTLYGLLIEEVYQAEVTARLCCLYSRWQQGAGGAAFRRDQRSDRSDFG